MIGVQPELGEDWEWLWSNLKLTLMYLMLKDQNPGAPLKFLTLPRLLSPEKLLTLNLYKLLNLIQVPME